MLGLTFKQNPPDLRNTRVVDVCRELEAYSIDVNVHDPWIDPIEAVDEDGIKVIRNSPEHGQYDGIVLAVGHDDFRDLGATGIHSFGKPERHVLYGPKRVLNKEDSDLGL